MVDEKLFEDAIKLATLWLSKSEAVDAAAYRGDVERGVQAVYQGLLAVRQRIQTGKV